MLEMFSSHLLPSADEYSEVVSKSTIHDITTHKAHVRQAHHPGTGLARLRVWYPLGRQPWRIPIWH